MATLEREGALVLVRW